MRICVAWRVSLGPMRYAITGATGFVGGVVARQLRDAGHEVSALVRDPSRGTVLTDLGAELVKGDLDDARALNKLCDGADGLFHVAGWYKVGSRAPGQGWRVNVQGTRRVLAAVERAGVPRVVYTSTLAVNSDTGGAVVDETFRFEGEHLSVYDETKAQAHGLVAAAAASGSPVVTVMPGLVYGPGDTSQTGAMISDILAGRRPMLPAGGAVCWGHVEDVARGHLLAMDRGTPGESYMLAGQPASLADGLRLAAELAGTRGPVVLPSAAVRLSGGLVRQLERRFSVPKDYAAESMRASLASYLGSPAKAERELGWTSRPLREGLADVALSTPTRRIENSA